LGLWVTDRCNCAAGSVRVDLALIHYPVVNKNGETIGSAVTNLDLHDIARAARTFGVDSLYMVSPYEDQHRLVTEILEHWLHGYGSRYNGNRGEALALVRQCADLEELYERVASKWGERPTVLTTCARPQQKTWPYSRVRKMLQAGDSLLILFGTAWGLAPEVLAAADGALPPITGPAGYNHLSVRSAASIVLDRLLGAREEI
jgi:hypothetical protein